MVFWPKIRLACGGFSPTRSRVTGGDRGLQRIGAEPAAECLGALERRETTTDEELIPAGAVLIEQQDGRSAGIDASRRV